MITRIVAAALVLFATAAKADEPLVTVELFTSQGCNSCPPADAFLGELAARDDVLALGYHITYWDRLGWPDTFGRPGNDSRQRDYAGHLGNWQVYTPQMVIGGTLDAVGSSRSRVLEAIRLVKERPPARAAMRVELEDDRARIELPGGDAGDADLLLAVFDRAHTVDIARGENAGRTLTYHHVVRDLSRLAQWDGTPAMYEVALGPFRDAGRDGFAVLLQRQSDGVMLAAARVDFAKR